MRNVKATGRSRGENENGGIRLGSRLGKKGRLCRKTFVRLLCLTAAMMVLGSFTAFARAGGASGGGGLVAWYLMYTNILGLKGTTFAIWFPAIMSPFLVILMRTFITGSVPDAIVESAKIDGAGHGMILTRIVLPVLGPGLATVGLFLALGYWNDWYRSSMFSTDSSTWELQFYLYNMLNASQALKAMSQASSVPMDSMPGQTMKLAMAVVATGPVLIFYPFVQRYFVTGITIGAVKG